MTLGFLAIMGNPEQINALQPRLADMLPTLPGEGVSTAAAGFAAFEIRLGDAAGANVQRAPLSEADTHLPLAGYLRLDTASWTENHVAKLRERYRQQGERAFTGLTGDIGCCLWDAKKQQAHLLSGPLATRPVYFTAFDGGFAAASQPQALLRLPGVANGFDSSALIRRHVAPFTFQTQTLWPGISKLAPGEHLRWETTRGVFKTKIWQPDLTPWVPKSNAEMAERVNAVLLDAVARRSHPGQVSACELSGGLDSSAILGALVHGRQPVAIPPLAYARVLAEDDPDQLLDERSYVDQAAAHCGIQARYRNPAMQGDDLSSWEQRFARFGHFEGGVGNEADALYQLAAADGANVMYCGAGGDEFISYHCQPFLAELLWTLRWPRLARELQMHARAVPHRRLSRLIRSKVLKPFIPHATPNNERDKDNEIANRWFLQPEVVHRERQARPLPIHNPPPTSLLNLPHSKRFQLWLYEHGFNSNRAHREVPVAASYGLDLRYPLLDAELVELALQLPSDWHFRNGFPRNAMRQSTMGILPASIRWRQDKRPPMPGYARNLIHTLVRLHHCFDEVIDAAVVGELFDLPRLRAALSQVQPPTGHGYSDDWYNQRVKGTMKTLHATTICWYLSWQARQG